LGKEKGLAKRTNVTDFEKEKTGGGFREQAKAKKISQPERLGLGVKNQRIMEKEGTG